MKVIKKGDKGEAVKLAQERLIAKGYSLDPWGADGDFGDLTTRRVQQFQAAQNLKADGVVGDRTWDALMADGRAPTPDEVLAEEKTELIEKFRSQLTKLPTAHRPAVERCLLAAVGDLNKKEIPYGSNWGPEVQPLVDKYNEYWWTNLSEAGYERAKKRGYVESADLDGNYYAWCGMAVSNWIRIGLELPYWDPKHGYDFPPEPGWHAPNKKMPKPLDGHPFHYFWGGPAPVEEWAAKEGYFKVVSKASLETLPGDIFTMGRGSSGSDPSQSVEAGHIGMIVADDGDYVITIEGNISNGVYSRRRRKTDLRWIIRWWK